MTGFVEIQPTGKVAGTGVRLGLSERGGLIISIWGEALVALGGGELGPVKAYLDMDPALPRLRIERHVEGRFRITKPQRGFETRLVRLGHPKQLGGAEGKKLACSWESVEGKPAIDIDLPREITPAPATRQAANTIASTSTSHPRTTAVSLPRVGAPAGDARNGKR